MTNLICEHPSELHLGERQYSGEVRGEHVCQHFGFTRLCAGAYKERQSTIRWHSG